MRSFCDFTEIAIACDRWPSAAEASSPAAGPLVLVASFSPPALPVGAASPGQPFPARRKWHESKDRSGLCEMVEDER